MISLLGRRIAATALAAASTLAIVGGGVTAANADPAASDPETSGAVYASFTPPGGINLANGSVSVVGYFTGLPAGEDPTDFVPQLSCGPRDYPVTMSSFDPVNGPREATFGTELPLSEVGNTCFAFVTSKRTDEKLWFNQTVIHGPSTNWSLAQVYMSGKIVVTVPSRRGGQY